MRIGIQMKMKRMIGMGVVLALLGVSFVDARGDEGLEQVAGDMPRYEKVGAVSGTVTCVGSSTVANLLNRWSAEFRGIYPGVEVKVTGPDSSAAPPALLAGTADIGPMSRPMTGAEVEAFRKKFGYEPLRLAVAADAIAVYVEKDNPVKALSLTQLDGIFSQGMKRGGPAIRKWKEVGVGGELGEMAIGRYAIAGESGVVSVFEEKALAGGALAFDVTRFHGSSSVVQQVAVDPAGIAFASAVLKTKRTRQVPLVDEAGVAYAPTYENVLAEKYPLTRLLYVYVNKPPKKKLSPAVAEFLKFVLSSDGQQVAASGGNMPLTTERVVRERGALGE